MNKIKFFILSIGALFISISVFGQAMPQKEVKKTVRSTVQTLSNVSQSLGSGTIIKKESSFCRILTCAHCVLYDGVDGLSIDSSIIIGISDNELEPPSMDYMAKVTAFDIENDLAILDLYWKISRTAHGMRFIPLSSEDLRKFEVRDILESSFNPHGSSFFSVGFPQHQGALISIDRGVCSGYYQPPGSTEQPQHYRVSASNIQHGISGGSIIDANRFELIGVPAGAIEDPTTKEKVSLAIRKENVSLFVNSGPWPSITTQFNSTFRKIKFKVVDEITGVVPQNRPLFAVFPEPSNVVKYKIEKAMEETPLLVIILTLFTDVDENGYGVKTLLTKKISNVRDFTIAIATWSEAGEGSPPNIRIRYFPITPVWSDKNPIYTVSNVLRVINP